MADGPKGHSRGIVEPHLRLTILEKPRILLVPRPGIEPGLEVPETSVMSFSLPGQVWRTPSIYQGLEPDKHACAR